MLTQAEYDALAFLKERIDVLVRKRGLEHESMVQVVRSYQMWKDARTANEIEGCLRRMMEDVAEAEAWKP